MKTRILFVIGMFAGGGAEKVLINMVNQLDLNKYDITIYSVFDTGRKPDLKEGIKLYFSFKVGLESNNKLKENNIKSKIQNFIFTYMWKIMPMKIFYKFAIKEKYDYEIAYVEGIPHKIIAASTNKKSKKYAWIHIDLSVHKRASEFYLSQKEEKKCYKKFNKLVFVSNYAKNAFQNKYGKYDTCIIQYNLNENEKIKKLSLEELDDIPRYRPLLVTVGRLHDQKGYDRLLQVTNELIKECKKFELWIIGDGDKKDEFMAFIQNNCLNEYIKLKGFQKNPYKYIAAADWFIAPSRYEGFSTVVSEAIILGKPILVTDCSGMNEITENGKYGIVVKNSYKGVYNGIKEIINMNNKDYLYWTTKSLERNNFFEPKQRIKEIDNLLSV